MQFVYKTSPAKRAVRAMSIGAAMALALICFVTRAENYTVTTYAGPLNDLGAIDGPGAIARFNKPFGVVVNSGRIYVADSKNNTVRVIDSQGNVSTLAGTAGVAGSTDDIGAAASFNNPTGIVVDGFGNVYVSDTNNHTIRKITPAGVVSTFVGSQGNIGSTNGQGNAAKFFNPQGLSIDAAGIIYVADSGNNKIRVVTPGGLVSTLAGSGNTGSGNGTGAAASFASPSGVAADTFGNVYVADYSNNTIRKIIVSSGVVTTFAGTAPNGAGYADAQGISARFSHPTGVAVDSSGNVYVADQFFNIIRGITPSGAVTTIAANPVALNGDADGFGSDASFFNPSGITVDGSGIIYVADTGNSTIRRITGGGQVSTFAGNSGRADGPNGFAGGTAANARFFLPVATALDLNGNVFVSDVSNNAIRKISPAGTVSTVLGGLSNIYGLASDLSGNFYYKDFDANGTNANVITKFVPGGASSIFVTNNNFFGNLGLATDTAGNVYVANPNDQTISIVAPNGTISLLAGTATKSGFQNGQGSGTKFNMPSGLCVTSNGNVYVADTVNNVIRQITPTGVVTTFAGTPGVGIGSLDGIGTKARFNAPQGVAADNLGNLFVADSGNNTIRKIYPSGMVVTIAGMPLTSGTTDGPGSIANFNAPRGLTVDNVGNVYIADTGNNNIRLATPTIPDLATIDAISGAVGAVRQLGTAPQTATSWSWTLIRRPGASTAQLSSTTIANPMFTPDTPDVFIFQLVASNATGRSISTVTLTATPPPPPVISSTLTASGNVGVPFTNYAITATNFPTSFNATGLPAGLMVNPSTGAIFGTPTASGTSNVTITASNSGGTNSKILVVTILPALSTITSPLTVNATVNFPFSYTILATNNPTGFNATGLPMGLTIDMKTGIISGTPTLEAVSMVTLTVTNAGGLSTATLTLNISASNTSPTPTLTSISPTSVNAGAAAFTLTATGTNFTVNSLILINGTLLKTTYVSSTTLTATVPTSAIATAGTANITVASPAPGGGTTAPLPLTIIPANPLPTLVSISPNTVNAGSGAFTLTVTGTNFIASSVIQFNGIAVTTTFVSATTLTTNVPAAAIGSAGTVSVSVFSPMPGGGTSSSATLTINAVAVPTPPSLIAINPSSVTVGSAAFALTATGTTFTANSIVQVNGSARATTFVSATSLTATILSSDVAAVGAQSITVFTPGALGGTSNAVTLSVISPSNPVPSISSISPSTVPAGSGSFTLTVTGANFIASTVVNFNGSARVTTFVSSTSLTATILADDVANVGAPNITAFTPLPGGGTSAPIPLTVTAGAGTGTGSLALTSSPASSKNPAVVGETISFSAAATDSTGAAPGYAWNFGDGTMAYGPGVAHVYVGVGTYIVTVTISNAIPSRTIYYKFIQTVDSNGASGVGFSVTKATITFNFKTKLSDSLVYTGTLPLGASFDPAGKSVVVSVGQVPTKSFILTNKGSGTLNGTSSFKLSGKTTKGAFASNSANFTLTLKNQDLFTGLASYGFTNANVPAAGVAVVNATVPITITVNGIANTSQVSFTYTAKKDKSGVARH